MKTKEKKKQALMLDSAGYEATSFSHPYSCQVREEKQAKTHREENSEAGGKNGSSSCP
jgi:hypothetical protein